MEARIIANYLPQFHPIPENDKFWGKGFTEWTNVAKAKPVFWGHYQPRIPADLGFYDLRLPEVREQQAQLAKEAGVEGFCYWHYWFGNGKRLLERPFKEVLKSGKPDFPFCLCWANHSWTNKSWKKDCTNDIVIAEQKYLGKVDYTNYFYDTLPAFKDHRYITVDGKPLFVIYDPYHFPDIKEFICLWRELAEKNGLKGIYFVGMCNSTTTIQRNENGSLKRVIPNLASSKDVYESLLDLGFDGLNSLGKSRAEMLSSGKWRRIFSLYIHQKFPWLPVQKYNYPKVVKHFFSPEDKWENIYPTVMPQWDRTPRAGKKEGIYYNSTPQNFKKHLEDALTIVEGRPYEHKILFLRSWNEWAEGNYVEPDLKFGHGFLDAIKECIKK